LYLQLATDVVFGQAAIDAHAAAHPPG
jgi:hypothetical protein